MDRNLVPISLGRANVLSRARMRRTNLSILKNENFATPVDGVISKAGKPDCEGYQVSDGPQPQMPPNSAVMHHSDSYFDCHGGAQSSSGSQHGPRPPGSRRKQHSKHRPRQAEGEKQADVTEAARIARAAGPAHLVLKKSAEAVSRQMSL